jgi:hypothetical protein
MNADTDPGFFTKRLGIVKLPRDWKMRGRYELEKRIIKNTYLRNKKKRKDKRKTEVKEGIVRQIYNSILIQIIQNKFS